MTMVLDVNPCTASPLATTRLPPALPWRRAATALEPLADKRSHGAPAATPDGDQAADAARAVKRMQRWRSQAPFESDAAYARKLAALGASEAELLALLAGPTAGGADQSVTPPWAAAWEHALQHGSVTGAYAQAWPATWQASPLIAMLDVVEPLITAAVAQLQTAAALLAERHRRQVIDPRRVGSIFLALLPPIVIPLLARTLSLELNVARLQGLLTGETPQARFQSFIRGMCQRDRMLAWVDEYPVLARQLAEHIQTWADVSIELLRHLHEDAAELNTMLGPAEGLGRLLEVSGEGGDRHRGGRSVRVLRFECGTRVVYKPRSLTIERHFQDLLQWLNQRGFEPAFRTLRVLERGDHGWVEFVTRQDCLDDAALQRFYRRQGGYLALLYALGATDSHYENLIAAGEHPVLLAARAGRFAVAGGVAARGRHHAAKHRTRRLALWFAAGGAVTGLDGGPVRHRPGFAAAGRP